MRADQPYPLCSAFFRVQSNLNPTSHNPGLQKPPPFTHFPPPKLKVPRSLKRPISPCFDLSHQALNPVSPIATPALQPTLMPKFSTPQPHHYHLIYLYRPHRTTSRHGDFICIQIRGLSQHHNLMPRLHLQCLTKTPCHCRRIRFTQNGRIDATTVLLSGMTRMIVPMKIGSVLGVGWPAIWPKTVTTLRWQGDNGSTHYTQEVIWGTPSCHQTDQRRLWYSYQKLSTSAVLTLTSLERLLSMLGSAPITAT